MALTEGQVQIRDLVLGPGTPYTLRDFNPFVRNVRADQGGSRAWNDGTWSGAEFLDEVTVPLRIFSKSEDGSAGGWLTNHFALLQAFDAVRDGISDVELRFNIGGIEYLMFGRPRMVEPDVEIIGTGKAFADAAFVANDPHIYSAEQQTVLAGLPTFTGGLTVPGKARQIESPPFGLILPGDSGDYASTPDDASLDITGDIDLRAEATLDDWTPDGNPEHLISKYPTSGERSYRVRIQNTGEIAFGWSDDGTNQLTIESSVAPSVSDGDRLAIRVAVDADNGNGDSDFTFYTAPSIDGPWAQLGDVQNHGSTISINSGTGILEIGSASVGGFGNTSGVIHAAEVRDGIDGTIVAKPRFERATDGTSSFDDSRGKTWTINGNATINSRSGTYSGLAAPLMVSGTKIGGIAELVNNGISVTDLSIRVDGPVESPKVSVVDEDGNSETLNINMTLNQDQFVVIDTSSRRVLLNGIGNRRNQVSGDFPLLKPGKSDLLFNARRFNETAQLTVQWRHAW